MYNKFVSLVLIFVFISGVFVGAFNSVVAKELVEDSWTAKAPMNQARRDLGVVAADGKIYAIGGRTSNGRIVDTTECYDPVADTWVTLAPMPTHRANFAIAAYQGKIYCIGGETSDENGTWIACGVTEVYDTVTNSWTVKKNLPIDTWNFRASVLDGQIFVVTRWSLYMYDHIKDLWIEKISMFETDPFGTLFVSPIENKLVVVDARCFSNLQGFHSEVQVMIYDPTTNKWTKGSTPDLELYFKYNLPGGAGATTGLYTSPKFYLLEPTIISVYDLENDEWSTVKSMPTPRTNFGVAVVDDILYVIGGYHYEPPSDITTAPVGPLTINEQYVPLRHNSSSNMDNSYSLKMIDVLLIVACVTICVTIIGLSYYSKKKNHKESTRMIRKA